MEFAGLTPDTVHRGWTPRRENWLFDGGEVSAGFYPDYGLDHYRSPHQRTYADGRTDVYCSDQRPCCDCQPGNVLAVVTQPGASRYFETVEQARAWIEANGR
jgi:hypothetical protein